MDNDDDEDLGAPNDPKNCYRSGKVVTDSSSDKKSPILSFFSSFFKAKSTPSEEQCQQHLNRIRLEIKKVQQMSDTTHNAAVQADCARRIAKLNDEKRFYQIIKEQHKIRHMFKTTKMEGVKYACKERMRQLMIELDSLDMKKENDFNVTVESTKRVEGQDRKEEDVDWYQRVLQYVNVTNSEQYQDQREQAAQQLSHQPVIPISNEQKQQQYPHKYDQQNIGDNNKEHLLPQQYQQQPYLYHHQQHDHLDHQARGPRKMKVLIQENRHVPFDSQPSNYPNKSRHSLPQHQHIRPSPRSPQRVHESASVSNNGHYENSHYNDKIKAPPRKGTHTMQRLPLATPVPPKKEGLNKLISYLAP